MRDRSSDEEGAGASEVGLAVAPEELPESEEQEARDGDGAATRADTMAKQLEGANLRPE